MVLLLLGPSKCVPLEGPIHGIEGGLGGLLVGVFVFVGGVFCLGEGCPPPAFGHPRQRGTGFLFLSVVLFAVSVLFLLVATNLRTFNLAET